MTEFKLTVEDALALAAAISDTESSPESVVLPQTRQILPIVVSKNGCRRVDVHVRSSENDDGVVRRDGWMKLMEQNTKKGSKAAQRARNGSTCVKFIDLAVPRRAQRTCFFTNNLHHVDVRFARTSAPGIRMARGGGARSLALVVSYTTARPPSGKTE